MFIIHDIAHVTVATMNGVRYVNGSIKDSGTARTVATNDAYNKLNKIQESLI
jgi:hypothetical protein